MITFTKVALPFGWLGNMSPYPVTYKGQIWRTTEALFQAMRFENETIKELIRAEKSPMGAKMKAKKHKAEMVIKPMSAQDVENMKTCLQLKVEQHPVLKIKLKSTRDRVIVEDIGKRKGQRHLFWGAKIQNGQPIGENTLGKLWMALREELQ